jgi:hypothetical protein
VYELLGPLARAFLRWAVDIAAAFARPETTAG